MAYEKSLTLAEARKLLYQHATGDCMDVSGVFKERLNEAIERILGDGLWDGVVVRTEALSFVADGILTLPYNFEAMIAVAVEDTPRSIVDEGHEFQPGGPGIRNAEECGSLVIDLGFNEVGDQEVRQYKFTMDMDSVTSVQAQLKRRFVYADSDTDLIIPSNLGALKHALLAVCFEDEGDIDRSEAYWAKCYEILDKQKQTNNIGVVRTQNNQPWGFMTNKPQGMM